MPYGPIAPIRAVNASVPLRPSTSRRRKASSTRGSGWRSWTTTAVPSPRSRNGTPGTAGSGSARAPRSTTELRSCVWPSASGPRRPPDRRHRLVQLTEEREVGRCPRCARRAAPRCRRRSSPEQMRGLPDDRLHEGRGVVGHVVVGERPLDVGRVARTVAAGLPAPQRGSGRRPAAARSPSRAGQRACPDTGGAGAAAPRRSRPWRLREPGPKKTRRRNPQQNRAGARPPFCSGKRPSFWCSVK